MFNNVTGMESAYPIMYKQDNWKAVWASS